MYLRQKHNRKINEELIRSDYDSYGADESEPESENIRTVIEQAEFSNLELLETINSLSEHHRLVFNLYVIDNYTHVQIGEELKISTGTSKSHLARARKRVRQLLYEKAMEKNQAMKKNRRALFLLIFPAKSNYIDEIFRRKFQNYSLQPLKEPSFFADSDRWNQEIIYRAPWYSRLKKYWIAGPVSGFILLALLVYVKFGLTQADIPVDKSEIKESVVPVVKAGGPPPSEGNAKAIPDADSLQKVNKEKKTVVIYKTIIQHKPLIIRDTIKIKDTTSAK
jgi:hypothetical protein